jgi:hypothetical protein
LIDYTRRRIDRWRAGSVQQKPSKILEREPPKVSETSLAGQPFHVNAFNRSWAASAETSFLLTAGETKAALESAGFKLTGFHDVTQVALGWLAQQQGATVPAPLTLAMIVGPRVGELVANLGRNLREGRVRLAMGICEAL